jgi:hypothetical protein
VVVCHGEPQIKVSAASHNSSILAAEASNGHERVSGNTGRIDDQLMNAGSIPRSSLTSAMDQHGQDFERAKGRGPQLRRSSFPPASST